MHLYPWCPPGIGGARQSRITKDASWCPDRFDSKQIVRSDVNGSLCTFRSPVVMGGGLGRIKAGQLYGAVGMDDSVSFWICGADAGRLSRRRWFKSTAAATSSDIDF